MKIKRVFELIGATCLMSFFALFGVACLTAIDVYLTNVSMLWIFILGIAWLFVGYLLSKVIFKND